LRSLEAWPVSLTIGNFLRRCPKRQNTAALQNVALIARTFLRLRFDVRRCPTLFVTACVLKSPADLPSNAMKDFREMKQRGEKITALTAYDYPTARLLDETGIDIILVGDSLGMVVLGYQDTTPVTLEEMLHHTRAAARGIKQALLVADMPIHTYDNPEQAIATARKFVDAGAQAVKLEGGASHMAQIEAITQEGIPFMAHIGMLPQSVREEGGYRIKGRTQSEAEALLVDARAVEKAGAFSVVLEIVLADVAKQITNAIAIPTIGIGSGDHCDGQILVTHDLIGLFPWFTPKFVSPEARVAEEIRRAARAFIERTRGK
jgi:3-methyl-2-oxobutanoate hydroxymethyltransferase